MPVINGVKMACAPCIRGHRSTKCAHHDRVMIAVKKPGRPLSTCPHAPGIQCGCGGVQAAIPIQHHGRCPPPAEKGPCHDVTIKAEDDSPHEKMIQSPTRTTQRVKKSSRDIQSRKQSIDPTALERMNPNALNIIASPSVSTFKPIDQGNVNLSNFASDVDRLANPQAISIGTSSSSTKESTSSPPPTGSCCGPKAKPAPHDGHATISNGSTHSRTLSTESSTPELSSQQAPSKAGGCCSSKAKANGTQVPEMAQMPTHQQIPMGAFIPQFPQFGNVASTMYAQQNVVNGMGFWPAQMAQQANGYMFPNGLMPQFQPTYQVYPPSSSAGMYPVIMGATGLPSGHANSIMDRPIQCHCGDICECLGCIDHPFNSATRDYVASAINVQSWTRNGDDETEGSTEDVQSSGASSSMPSPAGAGDQLLEQMMSPQSLQQQISSDYLVFNYSYGCLGEPEHCPCGDDCACVGCTIHAGRSSDNSQSLDLSG